MLLEYLSSFYTSAAWLRLFIDAFLYVSFFFTNRQYKLPFGKGLVAIPIILAARDLFSFFVPSPVVFIFSDGAIMILYAWWLSAYNDKLMKAKLFSIVNGVVIGALGIAYSVAPTFQFAYIVVLIYIIAGTAWFGIIMFNVSVYNTQNADFVIKNRVALISMLLTARVLLLIATDINSPLAQYVLYPISYIPHFFLIVSYLLYYRMRSDERDAFNTTYINSLFDFMRTIGSAMTERIEVKSVIAYVIKSITKYLNADAGVVMLREANEGVLKIGAMEGYFPPPFPVPPIVKTKLTGVQKFFENTPIKIGETVLGECAAKNDTIYVRKTADDPRFEANTKDDTLLISSIIVVPLIVNKDVFGVVAIMRRKRDNLFTDLEYERSRIFIEYASLTLDSLYNYAQLLEKQEIEREVSIAATIQKKLLPTRTPKTIASMVHAFSKPAKGVSGDYYDIIPLNAAGKFAMVICDVAGKGVPASLIMVMIRTIIHTIGGAKKNAAEVVSWINRGIAGRIDIERFATLSYLTYDPVARTLEYSNAGHHPVMIYRAKTGDIEYIDSPGLPIGLERDSQYQLVRVNLFPNDVILSYTDGILEAMNYRGEQFESDRVKEAFLGSIDKTPKEIVEHIRGNVDTFVGQAKQHDDMTLIVLKAH